MRTPFVDAGAATEQERVGSVVTRHQMNDMSDVPHRWVCSLDVTWPGRTKNFARGTGVLIGPNHVLTVGHNIYRASDGAGPTSVYAAPGRVGRSDPIGRFKAVAYSVSSRFLEDVKAGTRVVARVRENSRFDIALVTLERNVADVVYDRKRDPRPYGHWGHVHEGRFTHLRGLDGAFLAGKAVTLVGYPGDWCGTVEATSRDCDARRDQATVPFLGTGTVSMNARQPGLLLHTVDTYQGQSGSPVWMRFRDGTRYLVGIHTGPGTLDATSGDYLNNRAVHLSPEVVALVKTWMPGVNVI